MLISESTIASLERQSIINTILFYKEELLKIDKGEKATVHFNERQRKSLVKQGILSRSYGHGGCRLKLTNQTKQIMQNIVTNNIS